MHILIGCKGNILDKPLSIRVVLDDPAQYTNAYSEDVALRPIKPRPWIVSVGEGLVVLVPRRKQAHTTHILAWCSKGNHTERAKLDDVGLSDSLHVVTKRTAKSWKRATTWIDCVANVPC